MNPESSGFLVWNIKMNRYGLKGILLFWMFKCSVGIVEVFNVYWYWTIRGIRSCYHLVRWDLCVNHHKVLSESDWPRDTKFNVNNYASVGGECVGKLAIRVSHSFHMGFNWNFHKIKTKRILFFFVLIFSFYLWMETLKCSSIRELALILMCVWYSIWFNDTS